MNIRKILFVLLLLSSLVMLKPNPLYAASFKEIFTSKDSIIVRIAEDIKYFFTFAMEKKVEVLEKQAEAKLELARGYAEDGQEEKVQRVLERYQNLMGRLGKIMEKNTDGDVLGSVTEKIITQQTAMEEIKGMVGTEVKNEIVVVQEQVVNDVAEWVVVVNGPEGQTEFFQEVERVWAPGTGPGGGDNAVVVIEGNEMRFAPGTENGGTSGADIQNVVIESGNGNNVVND